MVKVIFLENINEYKVGDIKNIADGYARNFLIPRGIVKLATEAELKNVEQKIKKIQADEAKRVEAAKEIAKKIEAEKITVMEEVNEEGNLYGSTTAREIADALKVKGFEIEPSSVVIEEPIKELGEHKVIIRVGHGVETPLKIEVVRIN